ncbi:MAG: hypothetical protein NTX69_04425 [Candidatus Bipolaricaulota bacterium]|nr:hypothetical protein [Candidatus Bipolaricaulota bacterium]
MARTIPCLRTPQGLRALAETTPIDPNSVRRYLESKLKDALPHVGQRLAALALAYPSEELEAHAMDLYMRMRPAVAEGRAGWGQRGRLDIEAIDRLLAERVQDKGGAVESWCTSRSSIPLTTTAHPAYRSVSHP